MQLVIKAKRIGRKRANYFMTNTEVKLLWQYARDRWSSKFQVMLSLALFRGLRIGEICAVNLLDFSDNYSRLRVIIEKSYIDDYLPLIPELVNILKDYILRNKQRFKDGYLFPFYSSKRHSNHLDPQTAEAMFSKMRKIIGEDYPQFLDKSSFRCGYVKYRISWHSCRRWFETKIYDRFNDRKKLTDIMRYLDGRTVDSYIDPYETWKNEGNILQDTFDERIRDLMQTSKGQLRLANFM